ncbi:O-antigen ligase family protein [Bradyrhizobium sp. ORS 111]|uniref:O-antigen ligase family protein n=1 Tax=Bradyrhizobium sp. ORS 111 TaxID=1685958 RepID=UPI00388FF831
MPVASFLLTILLAAVPTLVVANGVFAQHTIALAAAVLLAMAVRGADAELTSTTQLLKRFSVAILVPVIWMVVQILPLPFASLANPIWSATSIALNEPSLPGRISLDPGATLQSLFVYLVYVSLVVSTVIISRDRHRAETILFVLCAVTTFMSLEVLLGRLHFFAAMTPATDAPTSPFPAVAALAAVTNTALISRALERHLHRRDIRNLASVRLWLGVLSGSFGIAAAIIAMAVLARGTLLAAAGFGLIAIAFVAAVRRLGFRSWPSAALFTGLVVIVCALAVPRFQSGGATLAGLARFAPETVALAGRMLPDAPWLGNGVGTFSAASRAYQNVDATAPAVPPSTAVLVAIESGRLALVILAGFAAQLFFVLFRGAVRRGRDSFFASAAAAGVLVVFFEGFLDSSLLSPAVRIIVAVMVGLGLAQSAGRTSGLKR